MGSTTREGFTHFQMSSEEKQALLVNQTGDDDVSREMAQPLDIDEEVVLRVGPVVKKPERLVSLDNFRGLTIWYISLIAYLLIK